MMTTTNTKSILSLLAALATATIIGCGGMEGDEYGDQYADDVESEIIAGDTTGTFSTDTSGGVSQLDNQGGAGSKEGKACNSSTGSGPYPGENGTYSDAAGSECCWTHCSARACWTSCLSCADNHCKDAALTGGSRTTTTRLPTSGTLSRAP